jgi:predicted TIM-barrel fold metal-dependent hydrolase
VHRDSSPVISADSHVVEPPEVWDRIEPALREHAPRLIATAERDEMWCDGVRMPPIELYVHARFRPRGEDGAPVRWSDAIPPAAHDPSARLTMLDADGIVGEVLFPTVTMPLMGTGDHTVAAAISSAYNSWLADFCREAPDRLKGVALLAPEEPQVAIGEARRARELGHAGAVLPLHAPRGTRYSDPCYDALWHELAALEMPVHLHAATGRAQKAWDAGTGAELVLRQSFAVQSCLLDLVLTGVFDRHPTLRVVSVENDAGWVPYLLARADSWWRRNGARVNDGGRRCEDDPSSYFHRNIAYTFMHDEAALRTHDLVGAENLMWSTDFPHPSTTWPDSRAVVAEQLATVSAEVHRRLVWENAASLYGFTAAAMRA